MQNIRTIDDGEWFHGSDLDLPRRRWAGLESRLENLVDPQRKWRPEVISSLTGRPVGFFHAPSPSPGDRWRNQNPE